MKDLLLQLLHSLLTPAAYGLGVTYGVLGLLWLYRHVSKQSAELKEKRIADVKKYAHQAYLAVTDLASRTTNTVDDKIATALGLLDQALQADGKPLLNELETQAAKLQLSATHGGVLLASNLVKDAAPLLVPPETVTVPAKLPASPS